MKVDIPPPPAFLQGLARDVLHPDAAQEVSLLVAGIVTAPRDRLTHWCHILGTGNDSYPRKLPDLDDVEAEEKAVEIAVAETAFPHLACSPGSGRLQITARGFPWGGAGCPGRDRSVFDAPEDAIFP